MLASAFLFGKIGKNPPSRNTTPYFRAQVARFGASLLEPLI